MQVSGAVCPQIRAILFALSGRVWLAQFNARLLFLQTSNVLIRPKTLFSYTVQNGTRGSVGG